MAIPLWGTIKGYILGAWSWLDDPIEGLWDGFRDKILGAWSWINTIDDKIMGRVDSVYPWLGIGSQAILGWVMAEWTWLNTIDDRIWSTAYSRITGAWSWINTIDDKIMSRIDGVYPWLGLGSQAILGWVMDKWTWLNTIDDRIRDTVSSRWTWLNTIDDRIKDIAWSHIAPKLGDWCWSFIVLEVTLVSKIGYRVLSTLWNMEWDDANKEAK